MNHCAQSKKKRLQGVTATSRMRRLLTKFAGGYNYDVTESYGYDFEGTKAIVHLVEMEGGRVCLPSIGEGRNTAFLKVEVNTSFLGKYVQPWVEIRAGAQSETQYFERGAKGTRYIDVSAFTGTPAVDIVLQGHHVVVAERQVELVCFENRIPENPTVMVIAPHPDDAEIAAYGLYSDIMDAYIVTITAGDAGNYNYDKLYDSDAEHFLKKGELRTWNSIAIPMLCGISPEHSINLGFFEGNLREMYNAPDLNVCGIHTGSTDINTYRKQNFSSLADELGGTANWSSLVANLTHLLERIKPDIIVTPHPVLDAQEDHRFSSIALFEAIKNAGLRDGHCFFYTNHIEFNHLYPYGRIGSMITLPPSIGESPYFTSIHSQALSPEKQRDKMFALEAMNDLRLNTDRKFSKEATSAALKAPLKEALGYDDSYYRRAVRRNELFFVVDYDDIQDEEKLALLVGVHSQSPVYGEQ